MASTTIMIDHATVERMRLASMSVGVQMGRTFKNDDQRLNALLDQLDNFPPAEQDSAGVSTPSPRQDMKRNPQMPA